MKPTKIELLNFLKDHDRKEASEFYKITSRTLRRWLQEYGLSRFDNKGAGKLDVMSAKKIRSLYASDQTHSATTCRYVSCITTNDWSHCE